ncbi:MAG: hypothetical protein U9P11_08435 [Pseudomonadota bacterium]|nr:hypothetical protein [Pseudomonadota bacterium]
MRCLFITPGGPEKLLWEVILRKVVDEDIEAIHINRFDFQLPAFTMLKGEEQYSLVLLPLTLPHFNSLRVAEQAHKLNLKTRIILISNTNCHTSILRQLFDYSIKSDELSVDNLKAAISKKIKRHNPNKINQAIESILKEASCFRYYRGDHIIPNPPNLRDYYKNNNLMTVDKYEYIDQELGILEDKLLAIVNPAL